jgi:hypothetical protein
LAPKLKVAAGLLSELDAVDSSDAAGAELPKENCLLPVGAWNSLAVDAPNPKPFLGASAGLAAEAAPKLKPVPAAGASAGLAADDAPKLNPVPAGAVDFAVSASFASSCFAGAPNENGEAAAFKPELELPALGVADVANEPNVLPLKPETVFDVLLFCPKPNPVDGTADPAAAVPVAAGAPNEKVPPPNPDLGAVDVGAGVPKVEKADPVDGAAAAPKPKPVEAAAGVDEEEGVRKLKPPDGAGAGALGYI